MSITSALDLMAVQHDEIDALVDRVATTSPEERTVRVSELADKLTLHLAVEQELLYPLADPLISDEVRAELAAEHQEIKRVLADLVWLEHEDQRFARKLVGLKNLLAWHEAWQEHVLFERIRRGLPSPQLTELGVAVTTWFERTTLETAAA
jgi:hemerythrin-like domain-containing protein